jgi:hypothetical protein
MPFPGHQWQVIMSGHSLGGFLVDSAALLLPANFNNTSLHFSSISFESPGVPAAVLKRASASCRHGSDVQQQQRRQQQQQQPAEQRITSAAASATTDPAVVLGQALAGYQQGFVTGADPQNCADQQQQEEAVHVQSIATAGGVVAGTAQWQASAAPSLPASSSTNSSMLYHTAAAVVAAECTGGTSSQRCRCRPSSMVSYLASPTPLNTLFTHPGLIYHVQPGNGSSSSTGSSSSSSTSDLHQQQWKAAEVALLAAIDAAR